MNLKNTKINWIQIERACCSIACQLENESKYDCIVCVGRGGMIPSRLLSEYLNVKQIVFVPVHYEKKKVIIDKTVDFSQFEGKNILIVDEVYQTGKSIKCLCDEIFNCVEEVSITTCACYFNKNSKTKPDVWHFDYDDSTTWLVFPWER